MWMSSLIGQPEVSQSGKGGNRDDIASPIASGQMFSLTGSDSDLSLSVDINLHPPLTNEVIQISVQLRFHG
ncbi:unnamed protein product [Merluccius merluccius]